MYIGGMYRRLLCVPVGSLKLKHLATSHERRSQIYTRQGIHEITDLQDVLLCTQQCIQGHKQLGEINIFLQWQPSCQKPHMTDIPVCITYDIIYTFPYPWI